MSYIQAVARRKKTRKKKGMLIGLRGSPTRKTRKKRTPFGVVVTWIGGIALGAVLLVLLGSSAVRLFAPGINGTARSGVFVVDEIRQTAGEPDSAVLQISGEEVLVPLDRNRRDAVEAGTLLSVRYVIYPPKDGTREIFVQTWELVEPVDGS